MATFHWIIVWQKVIGSGTGQSRRTKLPSVFAELQNISSCSSRIVAPIARDSLPTVAATVSYITLTGNPNARFFRAPTENGQF